MPNKTESSAEFINQPEIKLPLKRTWQIRSDYTSYRAATNAFAEILEKVRLDSSDIFDLRLAFDEVVLNSMQKGNQNNPDKLVKIDFEITETQAILTVQDEGEGMDRDSLPDPTDPENILKTGGRGVFFAESAVDQTTYKRLPDGFETKMIKNLKYTY